MRGSIFIYLVIFNFFVLVMLLFMLPTAKPQWLKHFARIHQEVSEYHQDTDRMRSDMRVDVIEGLMQDIEEEVEWCTSEQDTMSVTLFITALCNLGVYGLDVFLRQRSRKTKSGTVPTE